MGDPAYPAHPGRPVALIADPPQLFYIVGDDLWRHDFTTDHDERVTTLQNTRELAVSPDGKTIYFTRAIGRVRRNVITNFGDRPRPP